jgi:hypothetical protein
LGGAPTNRVWPALRVGPPPSPVHKSRRPSPHGCTGADARTRPSTSRRDCRRHGRSSVQPGGHPGRGVGQATGVSPSMARSIGKSAPGPSGVTPERDSAQAARGSTPAGRPPPSHGRCRSRARPAATRSGRLDRVQRLPAAVVAWSSCCSASVTAGPCCSSTATATASLARTSLGTRSVRSRGSLTPAPPPLENA